MAALHMNKEQFTEAIRGEKPVLVDFWAPWCGYCRRIGPAYDRIAQQYGDDMVIAKVNIDDEPQLSDAQQIEVIPTLVLYRGGKAVDSIVAPESRAMIEDFIHRALER